MTGSGMTLKWGIEKAFYFLELKGIELDINEREVEIAVSKYRGHINKEYPDLKLNVTGISK